MGCLICTCCWSELALNPGLNLSLFHYCCGIGFQTNKNDTKSVISYFAEALKAMEKVASHINEMQKIYEDHGTMLDQLVAEQSGTEKEVGGTSAF